MVAWSMMSWMWNMAAIDRAKVNALAVRKVSDAVRGSLLCAGLPTPHRQTTWKLPFLCGVAASAGRSAFQGWVGNLTRSSRSDYFERLTLELRKVYPYR
jgi:hypothetical protein